MSTATKNINNLKNQLTTLINRAVFSTISITNMEIPLIASNIIYMAHKASIEPTKGIFIEIVNYVTGNDKLECDIINTESNIYSDVTVNIEFYESKAKIQFEFKVMNT